MKNFYLKPKLFDTLKGYGSAQLTKDIIAGIIVAIIALPLSIALALASGVEPACGVYTAVAAGFMFVMIYCKAQSLIVCIAVHGIFNGLSAFSAEPSDLLELVVVCCFITLLTGAYGAYIALTLKRDEREEL